MIRKYLGTRQFYRRLLTLMVPILIQNGITNFVNMLDNIMVGRTGQSEMTGVSVANYLVFVFNLCIFGVVSGAGIFGAQFAGKNDADGIKQTLRFKIISSFMITAAAAFAFNCFGDVLVSLFLHAENPDAGADVMEFARIYLNIIIISLFPSTLAQCYASTLRENNDAVLPMASGIVSVFTNLILNYILIFGHLGFPAMGVAGAAIATCISKTVEALILVLCAHLSSKYKYIKGLFSSLKIPLKLIGGILTRGVPLMLNETLWATGMVFLQQCYSLRGLDAVAALAITSTFTNVFSVAFHAAGVADGIILGQILGSGNKEEAKTTAPKLIAFSIVIGITCAVLLALLSPFIPLLYNVSTEVAALATGLLIASSVIIPIDAFVNASYFTLRSGGQAFITFIFDSGFVWAVSVPLAFILSRYTSINVLGLYFLSNIVLIAKCFYGYYLVKKGTWIKTIIS